MDPHEYVLDLEALRADWRVADHDDADRRRWLLQHAWLKADAQCQVLETSPAQLSQLRRRLGMAARRGRVAANLLGYERRPAAPLVVPAVEADWRNPEWLAAATAGHGCRAVAAALEMSAQGLSTLLRNLGVPVHAGRRAHAAASREFCYYCYHTLDLPLREAARVAGTTHRNFRDWLIRFQIPLKQEHAAAGIRAPLWIRRALAQLLLQPCVKAARQRRDLLVVNYGGTIERYFYGHGRTALRRTFKVSREDARLDRPPRLHDAYDRAFGAAPAACVPLLAVDRGEFRRASFLERRVAAFTLVRAVGAAVGSKLQWPEAQLVADLAALRAWRPTLSGPLCLTRPRPNGRRLLCHFFDVLESVNWTRRPRALARVVRRLLAVNRPPSTELLALRLLARAGLLRGPATYAELFRRLGVSGTFYDPAPDFGARALACALVGVRYLVDDGPRWRAAVARGFAAFVGLDWAPFAGRADWSFEAAGRPRVGRTLAWLPGADQPEVDCQATAPAHTGGRIVGHYIVW